MTADWSKIRNEYISTRTSMRKLADKYGVSVDAIKRKAALEKWTDERTKTAPIIHQKTVQKVIEKTSSQEADRIAGLLDVSDRLVVRIAQAVDELDKTNVKTKKRLQTFRRDGSIATVEQEELGIAAALIDRRGVMQLSSALKTIADVMQGGKTDEDALAKVDKLIEGITDAAKS